MEARTCSRAKAASARSRISAPWAMMSARLGSSPGKARAGAGLQAHGLPHGPLPEDQLRRPAADVQDERARPVRGAQVGQVRLLLAGEHVHREAAALPQEREQLPAVLRVAHGRGGKGVDALDSPAPRKGAEAFHRLHGPLHGLLLQAARLHALAQARRLQELLRPSRLDEQQAHRIAPHVDHCGVPHLSSPPLFSRLLHKKDRIPRGMRVLFTFRPGSRSPPAGPTPAASPPAGPWALFRPPARSTPPLPPRPPLR